MICRFLIGSLILLAIGIFTSQCLIYSGMRHLEKIEVLQAEADFIMAARVNPFDIQGRYYSGHTLLMGQDYKGAVEYYSQVLRRAPYYLRANELKNKAMGVRK